MDSLTPLPVVAPAMPHEAPLAMPIQSLWRFKRSEQRSWSAPQLARTPWFARLFVFGGAACVTVYGAGEMYGVVKVGEYWRLARFQYDGGFHLIPPFLPRRGALDEDRSFVKAL